MPHLLLQPHVSFAMVDGRAIFLDLRRDRYLALAGASARAFSLLSSNPRAPLPAETAAGLLATGLFLTASGPATFLPAEMPRPVQGPGAGGNGAPPLADLVQTWLLLGQARRALRSRPLATIIGEQRGRNVARTPCRTSEEVVALARRFERARTWVPIKPGCLQDSLALNNWLARRNAFPSLVLGVKLDPFAAHCWVQLGETVLNDAPDKVSAFTPILAIP